MTDDYRPQMNPGNTTPTGQLPPGRELDALVAERVMGWKWAEAKYFGWKQFSTYPPEIDPVATTKVLVPPDKSDRPIPSFSTDIAAAWEVVDAMRYLHGGLLLDLARNGNDSWFAQFDDNKAVNECQTAPHAICLAALKTVGA